MLNLNTKKGSTPQNIIFLHGNSSSSRVYEEIFELSKIPHTLIRIDLPGHGDSPKSEDYTWSGLLGQLHEEISAFEGKKTLVGHSLGGHLAIELAPKIEDLSGLVIFGTPPVREPLNMEEAFLPNPNLGVLFQEEVEELTLRTALESMIQKNDKLSILLEDFQKTDPKFRIAMGANIAQGQFADEAQIFSTLTCKKLILQGAQEGMVNLDYLEALKNEAETPFDLIEVPDCGHYIPLEQPKAFYNILENFVQSN